MQVSDENNLLLRQLLFIQGFDTYYMFFFIFRDPTISRYHRLARSNRGGGSSDKMERAAK